MNKGPNLVEHFLAINMDYKQKNMNKFKALKPKEKEKTGKMVIIFFIK